MRIVITGATGFIGSNLAKLFLKKGAEVFVLVRPESTHLDVLPKDEKLHVVSCGLSNVMDCVSYIKEADAFSTWHGAVVNRQEIDSPEVQAEKCSWLPGLYPGGESIKLPYVYGCRFQSGVWSYRWLYAGRYRMSSGEPVWKGKMGILPEGSAFM